MITVGFKSLMYEVIEGLISTMNMKQAVEMSTMSEDKKNQADEGKHKSEVEKQWNFNWIAGTEGWAEERSPSRGTPGDDEMNQENVDEVTIAKEGTDRDLSLRHI